MERFLVLQTQTFGGIEEHLKMTDDFNLFCRHWPSAGEIKRTVIFLHGIEVHSGAFRFMVQSWQMLTVKFTLSTEEALEILEKTICQEETPWILTDT